MSIANLKLARFDGTRLTYAGTVGTGFSDAVGNSLREKLDRIQAARCILSGLKVAGAVWVEPDLKAEIAYRDLTGSGELRAASGELQGTGRISGRLRATSCTGNLKDR